MSEPTSTPPSKAELPGILANHRSWLRSVIVARLGNAQDAEDVLQDVNVAALEQRSPLRNGSAVTSWLYQLAVRQSLLLKRRLGRRRKQHYTVAESTNRDESEGDPLRWLLATERRDIIRQALARMPGSDRELLVLKYVESWSYRQIAEQTGRTERAVESKLHRARMRLRELLRRLDVVEEASESTHE